MQWNCAGAPRCVTAVVIAQLPTSPLAAALHVCSHAFCCLLIWPLLLPLPVQAYDAFGCQHQLYSRGKGKGQMWYEPVFRVTTLEGKEVWRRRR